MSTITVKDGTEIYYKDWGSGQPIVFSHGWPLSGDDWDAQMMFFLNHGYRVIAHDRRGHGRSSQPGDGHDMDHYADDLAALTAHLKTRVRHLVWGLATPSSAATNEADQFVNDRNRRHQSAMACPRSSSDYGVAHAGLACRSHFFAALRHTMITPPSSTTMGWQNRTS